MPFVEFAVNLNQELKQSNCSNVIDDMRYDSNESDDLLISKATAHRNVI